MNCSICQNKILSIKHNCVSTKYGHHFHCNCFLEFLEKNNDEEEIEERVYEENNENRNDILYEIVNEDGNNIIEQNNEQQYQQQDFSQFLVQNGVEYTNSIHSILNIYHKLYNHRSILSIKEKID